MEYLKKVLSKVWRLFEYYLVKLIDYRFKSRTIFWWGIKYFSLALAAELICIQTESQFSSLFIWINQNWGETWEIIIRTLIDLLGAGGLGWSYLTIFIKLYLITLFCLFEWNKEKKIQFSWKWIWVWNWNWKLVFNPKFELTLIKIVNNYERQFQIDDIWFQSNKIKLLSIPKSKYISHLHLPSRVESSIINLIKLPAEKNEELSKKNGLLNKKNKSFQFWIKEILNIEKTSLTFSINNESKYYSELLSFIEFSNNLEKMIFLMQLQ